MGLKENLVEVIESPRHNQPLVFYHLDLILVWNNGLQSWTNREQLIVPVSDFVEVFMFFCWMIQR